MRTYILCCSAIFSLGLTSCGIFSTDDPKAYARCINRCEDVEDVVDYCPPPDLTSSWQSSQCYDRCDLIEDEETSERCANTCACEILEARFIENMCDYDCHDLDVDAENDCNIYCFEGANFEANREIEALCDQECSDITDGPSLVDECETSCEEENGHTGRDRISHNSLVFANTPWSTAQELCEQQCEDEYL